MTSSAKTRGFFTGMVELDTAGGAVRFRGLSVVAGVDVEAEVPAVAPVEVLGAEAFEAGIERAVAGTKGGMPAGIAASRTTKCISSLC